jgi:hypothetical protein
MTYFDCFVAASWALAIGWFLGAIYIQNQNQKAESPCLAQEPETSSHADAWGLPAVSNASAAD